MICMPPCAIDSDYPVSSEVAGIMPLDTTSARARMHCGLRDVDLGLVC